MITDICVKNGLVITCENGDVFKTWADRSSDFSESSYVWTDSESDFNLNEEPEITFRWKYIIPKGKYYPRKYRFKLGSSAHTFEDYI